MRRASLTVLIAIAFLCAPAAALASTPFTWAMPHDFTTAAPGANPDRDSYGNAPWAYSSSSGAMSFSANFTSAVENGLDGWSTSGATSYIAVESGALHMLPASGGSVSITWTSPYGHSVTANVTGSATQVNASMVGCLPADVSATVNGATVNSGGVTQSITVPAGGTITLTVADMSPMGTYMAACDLEAVSLLQIQVTASAPNLTVASPSRAEPLSFSGTAGDGFPFPSALAVNVYNGARASGTPVQTISASESGGKWSVGGPMLAAGTYTVQATQSDAAGNRWSSGAVTFTIPPPPTVVLNSPGSAPLLTSTPTLTGTAGTTAQGYSPTVFIAIFSGTGRSAREVQLLSTTVRSDGSFSVQASPALLDGQYTAIAAQSGPGQTGDSSPQTFSIKVSAPALTLTVPARGADTSDAEPQFSGAAGDVFGDSSEVTVRLYSGDSTHGHSVGHVTVTRSGATWSARWPHPLALGLYTVTASQSDDAGHTTVTKGTTFVIVRASSMIGSTVKLSRSGIVTVAIRCREPSGATCSGTVLILTVKRYRPVRGGPLGRLRVLFAYVTIHGGQTAIVSRRLSGEVRRTLRHKRKVKVTVATTIRISGGPTQFASVIRRLRQH